MKILSSEFDKQIEKPQNKTKNKTTKKNKKTTGKVDIFVLDVEKNVGPISVLQTDSGVNNLHVARQPQNKLQTPVFQKN